MPRGRPLRLTSESWTLFKIDVDADLVVDADEDTRWSVDFSTGDSPPVPDRTRVAPSAALFLTARSDTETGASRERSDAFCLGLP